MYCIVYTCGDAWRWYRYGDIATGGRYEGTHGHTLYVLLIGTLELRAYRVTAQAFWARVQVRAVRTGADASAV